MFNKALLLPSLDLLRISRPFLLPILHALKVSLRNASLLLQ